MRAKATVAALAMLACVAAGGARADDTDHSDQFAKRMFAGDIAKQDKSYACFVRRYDSVHLARHKLQKVSVMKLLVTGEMQADEDDKTAKADKSAKNLSYSFRLGLNFRNRKGNFDSSGSCSRPTAEEKSPDKLQLGCGVDCDGGGISVELANADKSTLVRLERIRIWQNNKPDDEGLDLSGGADDRVFRLDRAKLDECRSLITDRAELAAMRHK